MQRDIEASIPWYCTSCGECTLRCPRDVKPSEMIFELRSALVEEGEIPLTIQKALENTYVQKNPWGRPKPKRGAWVDEAGLKIPHVKDTQSKRLLFTCCIQAYDPRCMVIPVNVAKILNKCGVEFGILGAEEVLLRQRNTKDGRDGPFRRPSARECRCFQKVRGEGDPGLVASLHERPQEGIRGARHQSVPLHRSCWQKWSQQGPFPSRRLTTRRSFTMTPVFSVNKTRFSMHPGTSSRPYRVSNSWSSPLRERTPSAARAEAEECSTRPRWPIRETVRRGSSKRSKKALKSLPRACPFCVMTYEDPATDKGLLVRELSEIMMEAL